MTEVVALISVAVSIVALLISFSTMQSQNKAQNHQRVCALTDRLYAADEFIIQNPGVQKLLYEQAARTAPYFVKDTPHDDDYFRVKSFIYFNINLFDEIFCTIAGDRTLETVFEFDAWKEYIVSKMRHPLFRELYDRESSIWGEKFRAFCKDRWGQICQPPDREMY